MRVEDGELRLEKVNFSSEDGELMILCLKLRLKGYRFPGLGQYFNLKKLDSPIMLLVKRNELFYFIASIK